jgi:hypothetical protein
MWSFVRWCKAVHDKVPVVSSELKPAAQIADTLSAPSRVEHNGCRTIIGREERRPQDCLQAVVMNARMRQMLSMPTRHVRGCPARPRRSVGR